MDDEIVKKVSKSVGLRTHVCLQCGKTFECRPEHVYKIHSEKHGKTKWFCTYTCLQAFRRQQSLDKRIPSEREQLVLEMLDKNYRVKDIIELAKMSKETIYKIRETWRSV